MGEQFHPRHVIHPNIQDCDGDRMHCQVSEKRVRFTERLDFKPGGPKNPDDGFPNRLVVIDKANNGRSVTHSFSLTCQPVRRNQTLVPGLAGGGTSAFCSTTMSSATDVIPSFCIICARWVLTVFSAIPSSAPTCLLSIPVATSCMTSCSRGVSRSSR